MVFLLRMSRSKTKQPTKINIPASDLPLIKEPEDFRSSFHWRVFRVMSELVDGWQFLADFHKTVTIFGSAQTPSNNKWYKEARELGKMLTDSGFSVVTGGGPGIMEAGNYGATEGKKGCSIGLNIQLPHEQRINPYVKKGIGFHYFFTRKLMLAYSAQAYVYFPGGYGTLDEFFEIITLIQTNKISVKIPMVLVGKEFWTPLIKWVEKTVHDKFNNIHDDDMKLYTLVDSAEEAFEIIKKSPERKEF